MHYTIVYNLHINKFVTRLVARMIVWSTAYAFTIKTSARSSNITRVFYSATANWLVPFVGVRLNLNLNYFCLSNSRG